MIDLLNLFALMLGAWASGHDLAEWLGGLMEGKQ